MLFKDRKEAGKILAQKLKKYDRWPGGLVLALPRGGVVVAYEVAKALHLPLDVLCARKVGAPTHQELAIGAVTELSGCYFNERLIHSLGVTPKELEALVTKEKQESIRRATLYRRGAPSLDLKGKTLLLVDDGIATGATIKASIASLADKGIARSIVAVPLSSQEAADEIASLVDELIVVLRPEPFYAVGQFYAEFPQTSDEEVMQLLSEAAAIPSVEG